MDILANHFLLFIFIIETFIVNIVQLSSVSSAEKLTDLNITNTSTHYLMNPFTTNDNVTNFGNSTQTDNAMYIIDKKIDQNVIENDDNVHESRILKRIKRNLKNVNQTNGTEQSNGHRKDMVVGLIFIPIFLITIILICIYFFFRIRYKNKAVVTKLDYPIKLMATIPDVHYFPRVSDVVRNYPEPMHYHLNVDTTVKFLSTSQLYHPGSGLLFQLVPNFLYDPIKQCNVRRDNGAMESSKPNQVYSTFTNEIFERYLFMAFNPRSNEFVLPNDYSALANISFILPQQVPREYFTIYQTLLQTMPKPNKSELTLQTEKVPALMTQTKQFESSNQVLFIDEPSDSLLNKQHKKPFLAPEEEAANIFFEKRPEQFALSKAKKNPLLLNATDFSKPQTADFHDTPRSGIPNKNKVKSISKTSKRI